MVLGEQPLLPYEACNLGSINLVNHLKPVRGKGNLAIGAYEIDWDKLSNTVKLATRFLDDVITVNNYPLEEIDTLTKASRKIGLGVMGFADALAMMNVPYDSEYAIILASSIMNSITSVSHKESNRLATMFGAYPAWYTCSKLAPDGVELPYVRNNTTTTIAPTGTLSIIADVSSGIEPFFSLAYYRNVMDGTKLPYVNNALLQKLDWWLSDDSKNYLVDLIIKNGGTLHNIMNHPEYDPSKIKLIHNGFSVKRFISTLEDIFKCAHDITPADHIKMQAAFQAYVDNAISKTINFSNSATKDDVYEAYMLAYNTGCKGTTIYRDGCRENQVLNTTTSEPPKHDTLEVQNMNYPENFYEVPAERRILYLDQIAHNQQYLSEIRSKISDSEGKHTGYPESFYDLPDDVRKRYTDQMLNLKASAKDKKVMHNRVTTASVTPEERPEEVSGFTKKIQIGCGKLYVTVNHDENGRICEVFTNNGKSGGCPSQSEATTRLVSIALRAGVDINEIIKQLRGIRCPSCQRNGNVKVLSCPDAIGRMLQEAKNRIDLSKNNNTAYVDMRINNNKVEVAGIDYDIEDVSDDVCCNVGEEPKEQTAYEKTLYEFYSKEILDMGSGIEDPSALKFSKVCPECGAPLEHEGGCVTCRNCGWSKCN